MAFLFSIASITAQTFAKNTGNNPGNPNAGGYNGDYTGSTHTGTGTPGGSRTGGKSTSGSSSSTSNTGNNPGNPSAGGYNGNYSGSTHQGTGVAGGSREGGQSYGGSAGNTGSQNTGNNPGNANAGGYHGDLKGSTHQGSGVPAGSRKGGYSYSDSANMQTYAAMREAVESASTYSLDSAKLSKQAAKMMNMSMVTVGSKVIAFAALLSFINDMNDTITVAPTYRTALGMAATQAEMATDMSDAVEAQLDKFDREVEKVAAQKGVPVPKEIRDYVDKVRAMQEEAAEKAQYAKDWVEWGAPIANGTKVGSPFTGWDNDWSKAGGYGDNRASSHDSGGRSR